MKNDNIATKSERAKFIDELHRSGRLFTIVAVVLISLVPLAYCISAKVVPDFGAIGKAFMFTLSYWAIGLIEAISYAPVLGVGGQYQSFITGNISNLKLPCSLNTQNILKTQNGTEEQEIIATIAISVSSIVTTLIILLGLIPLSIFGGQLVEALAPVSPYVIPAIFGGLGLVLLTKYFKLTIVPFAIMLAAMLLLFLLKVDLGLSTSLTVGMVASVFSGMAIYKSEKKRELLKPKSDIAKDGKSEKKDNDAVKYDSEVEADDSQR